MKLKAAILHLLGLQKTSRLMKIKGAAQFKKAFSPYFFSILVRLYNQGYFLKHFSVLKEKLTGKAFKNIHR